MGFCVPCISSSPFPEWEREEERPWQLKGHCACLQAKNVRALPCAPSLSYLTRAWVHNPPLPYLPEDEDGGTGGPRWPLHPPPTGQWGGLGKAGRGHNKGMVRSQASVKAKDPCWGQGTDVIVHRENACSVELRRPGIQVLAGRLCGACHL